MSSSRDGSVALIDGSDGALLATPHQFYDVTGSLASFFDPEIGEVVTIDSAGTIWRWSTRAAGLTTRVDASSSAPPAPDASEWFGTSGNEAISVTGTDATRLGFGSGLVDIVAGWSGNLVLVFDDRLEWRRRDGELVTMIDTEEISLGDRFAVTEKAMAYLVSAPDEVRRIVVVAADGMTIDTYEVGGDVQRLDISPAGDDLVYSTAAGELRWYSLDLHDTVVLLNQGGLDGHFVDDGLVVAVGDDGVQLVDLDDHSTPTDVGIGRGAVRVAFDALHGLAATSDRRGQLALWDLESRRQLGPSFSPFGDEPPDWIGITRDGHLVVDAHNGSMVVSLHDADWIRKACALAAALDPGGRLPPDPFLSQDEPCA